jgi:hypothetical protein
MGFFDSIVRQIAKWLHENTIILAPDEVQRMKIEGERIAAECKTAQERREFAAFSGAALLAGHKKDLNALRAGMEIQKDVYRSTEKYPAWESMLHWTDEILEKYYR